MIGGKKTPLFCFTIERLQHNITLKRRIRVASCTIYTIINIFTTAGLLKTKLLYITKINAIVMVQKHGTIHWMTKVLNPLLAVTAPSV